MVACNVLNVRAHFHLITLHGRKACALLAPATAMASQQMANLALLDFCLFFQPFLAMFHFECWCPLAPSSFFGKCSVLATLFWQPQPQVGVRYIRLA